MAHGGVLQTIADPKYSLEWEVDDKFLNVDVDVY